jgi:hypothetical protein
MRLLLENILLTLVVPGTPAVFVPLITAGTPAEQAMQ